MPCYGILYRRAKKLGISLPPMTDEAVREKLGAADHNEVHFILSGMGDDALRERLTGKKKEKKSSISLEAAYR